MPVTYPTNQAGLESSPLAVAETATALIEGVYGGGEFTLVDELIDPTFVGGTIDAAGLHVGRAGVRTHAAGLRAAFFGLTLEVRDVTGGPQRARVDWRLGGVQERPYLGFEPVASIGASGVEPGGFPVIADGATTVTVVDGRAVAAIWNLSALRKALGGPDVRAVQGVRPGGGAMKLCSVAPTDTPCPRLTT